MIDIPNHHKRFWSREDIARYLVADGLIRSGRLREAQSMLKPMEFPREQA
jgi:hypothetical protein